MLGEPSQVHPVELLVFILFETNSSGEEWSAKNLILFISALSMKSSASSNFQLNFRGESLSVNFSGLPFWPVLLVYQHGLLLLIFIAEALSFVQNLPCFCLMVGLWGYPPSLPFFD